MGAGGVVINQRETIKASVADPSIINALASPIKARAQGLLSRPVLEWTYEDTHFMATCIVVAVINTSP
jgi:hypothetical protein